MRIEFTAEIIDWRGPAPWYFLQVPEQDSQVLKSLSKGLTYGWGMIPVTAHTAGQVWKTSLFPKDGHYLLPLKSAVRKALRAHEGDFLSVIIEVP